MVCSSSGAKSGSSLNLGSIGSCPSGGSGGICKNPTGSGGRHDLGSSNSCASCISWCYACLPPDPFLAPCSGSAYTYPYDGGRRSAQLRELLIAVLARAMGWAGQEEKPLPQEVSRNRIVKVGLVNCVLEAANDQSTNWRMSLRHTRKRHRQCLNRCCRAGTKDHPIITPWLTL